MKNPLKAVCSDLNELNARLYDLAENTGGGMIADEIESCARGVAGCQEALERMEPCEAPTEAEKRLARERLHEILSDVARNDWRPWDCAETLARLMTPEAIKGLALEQLESEGGR